MKKLKLTTLLAVILTVGLVGCAEAEPTMEQRIVATAKCAECWRVVSKGKKFRAEYKVVGSRDWDILGTVGISYDTKDGALKLISETKATLLDTYSGGWSTAN